MSAHGPHSSDTTDDVHERQVARWRAMEAYEKLELVDSIYRDGEILAIAGSPDLSAAAERDVRHELAGRRYGRAFADEVYGSIG